MTNKLLIGGVVVAVVLSLFNFVRDIGAPGFGAAGGLLAENYWPYLLYNDGYKSEKNIELSGANGDITTGDDLTVTDDLTVSGGTFTLTTSNSATSTAIIGCQQMYATSTATAVRLLFHSTTSPSVISGTASGFVAWGYGSCPF